MKPRTVLISLSLAVVAGGAVMAASTAASGDDAQLAAGISVGGTDLSGLSRSAALQKLQAALPTPPRVTVLAGTKSWTVGADQLGWGVDLNASLAPALKASADRGVMDKLRAMVGAAPKQDFPLMKAVNAGVAKAALAKLTAPLAQAPVDAKIVFSKTRYAVTPDRPGLGADASAAAAAFAANPDLTQLNVTVRAQPARYTAAALQKQVDAGNALMRSVKVTLTGKPGNSTLTPLQVANLYWVLPTGIELDGDAIIRTVKRLAGELDHPAHDARYVAQGGKLVKVDGTSGVVVDQGKASVQLGEFVTKAGLNTLALPATASEPEITSADLPEPGALSIIAVGHSTYYGSHPERMTNIAVAASKLNGVVVPAGETFSFLNTIGHITDDNGFVGGLIISGGRTVEGLGGGVCQVSTTTFRALYSAGLPVVERNQHAYRVGYYEPQVGFEAAVYDPGLDLKMKNDTGGPIMLRVVNNPAARKLDIQVWGVKQTRKVTVAPATILSRTPHPPAQFVVNPALRPGQRRQVDWAADGYNLFITRTIKDANGAVRTDKVSTSYKPWRAVFEMGPSSVPAAKPVKPSGAPST